MPALIDLAGRRFGRLAVLTQGDRTKNRDRYWRCRCDCGAEVATLGSSLRSGATQSCGCLFREVASASLKKIATRHGQARTPTYRVWCGMVERCTNPNAKDYPRYGGRGITVCERWRVFENFLADMGERPAGLTLDREDGTRGYEPGNCRWATVIQQNRNRRNNVVLELDGVSRTLPEWAELAGICLETARQRLRRGWPPRRALNAPVQKKERRHAC